MSQNFATFYTFLKKCGLCVQADKWKKCNENLFVNKGTMEGSGDNELILKYKLTAGGPSQLYLFYIHTCYEIETYTGDTSWQ